MSEKTFDMTSSPKVNKGTYFPFRFKNDPPNPRIIRELTISILNYYGKKKISKTKWLKYGNFHINWKDEKGKSKKSKLLSFNIIHDHIKAKRKFIPSDFDLHDMRCDWLDSSVGIWPKFCAPCNQDESAFTFSFQPNLGSSFPVQPALDREGAGFSSMQLLLQGIILENRFFLVNNSELFFENFNSWFEKFLIYINYSISLFENTFHQLYNKAKYDHASMGWSFDEDKLGPSYGRRFMDKFGWIGKITGHPLDNAEPQKSRILKLKNIRNHINHFDPPTFVFSIEDATIWLNNVFDTAELIIKMREKIGSPLSLPLIEMLLSPQVEFVPFDPGKRRPMQSQNVGYSSCIWQKSGS